METATAWLESRPQDPSPLETLLTPAQRSTLDSALFKAYSSAKLERDAAGTSEATRSYAEGEMQTLEEIVVAFGLTQEGSLKMTFNRALSEAVETIKQSNKQGNKQINNPGSNQS